ncbi:MAG TPA: hypothetical protein V6D10_07190 [Trichocoleus sp.]|jgi:hypothetical protein
MSFDLQLQNQQLLADIDRLHIGDAESMEGNRAILQRLHQAEGLEGWSDTATKPIKNTPRTGARQDN